MKGKVTVCKRAGRKEGGKAEVDEETGEEEDAAKASSAAGSLQGLAEVQF